MAALLENILLGKEYLAVEFFHSGDKEKITFLKVQKKKNELAIAQKEIFEDVTDLSAHKSKVPLSVVINNNQVLQKEVKGIDLADKKLLHKAFPNLQTEDFYYEIWRHEQVSLIAICRKSYVDKLLDKLGNEFRIAAVSLGILRLSNLSGFVLPPMVTTNTQKIFLEAQENLISPDTVQNADYDINGLNIPNTHLLAFCGVLQFILPSVTTGSMIDKDLALSETFKQKTFFDKGIKTGISILLGLLLINFFLFSYYFDKAEEMTETVSLHKVRIENITKIRKRIKEKEQRLENFSSNAASASSLVINDLIKNIPSSILLSEIAYHPLEKKIKAEEAIQVKDSLLLISGATLSNTAFTGWIGEIESSKWVNSVTITSFGKDTENNTKFSVSIILKK